MSLHEDFFDALAYGLSAMKTSKPFQVFYAGLHYDTYPREQSRPWTMPGGLPDGAYIYDPDQVAFARWYRSDHTPVLLQDVPPELKAWVLLLG